MSALAPLLFALVGAVMGSMIGLLTLRLPLGQPVGLARSRCSACHHRLAPRDLIPLLSFALQKRRCRHCAASIPWRYPMTESGAAAIGAVCALALSWPMALAGAILGWWLLLLAILDSEHFWLPDRLTLPLILAGLAATYVLVPAALPSHAIGAGLGYISLSLVAFWYRRVRGVDGMGGGDAKLFAASGAWLGWAALPEVLLVAAISGLIGALLLHRGKISAQTQLPFGAFLAAATWLIFLLHGYSVFQ